MTRTATLGFLTTLLCLLVSAPGNTGETGLSVPTTLSYQGYLADASGEAVSGGFPMVFALYDQSSGGESRWQEAHASVTVLGGFFQVELGLETPLEMQLFDGPLFLGISIDGDPEIAPRSTVGSHPFARRAEGLLACAVGETNCFGVCAILDSDVQNCGACGNACADGDTCISGQCVEQGTTQFFRDSDEDGFGVCSDFIFATEPSAPYTATACGDCDDANPNTFPGATELCDGIDNDCDGAIDEDAMCDDGVECTDDICGPGMCQHPPRVAGSMCSVGVCDGLGGCVECLFAEECGVSSACTTFTCTANACGVVFSDEGTPCEGGGICDGAGTCVGPPGKTSMLNGNGPDLDCGGPDRDACEDGEMCMANSDCALAICVEGICHCPTEQTRCSSACNAGSCQS